MDMGQNNQISDFEIIQKACNEVGVVKYLHQSHIDGVVDVLSFQYFPNEPEKRIRECVLKAITISNFIKQ